MNGGGYLHSAPRRNDNCQKRETEKNFSGKEDRPTEQK